MKIESAEVSSGQVSLKGLSLLDNKPFEFTADKVLIAAGRRPNIEDLVWDENLLAEAKGKFPRG